MGLVKNGVIAGLPAYKGNNDAVEPFYTAVATAGDVLGGKLVSLNPLDGTIVELNDGVKDVIGVGVASPKDTSILSVCKSGSHIAVKKEAGKTFMAGDPIFSNNQGEASDSGAVTMFTAIQDNYEAIDGKGNRTTNYVLVSAI